MYQTVDFAHSVDEAVTETTTGNDRASLEVCEVERAHFTTALRAGILMDFKPYNDKGRLLTSLLNHGVWPGKARYLEPLFRTYIRFIHLLRFTQLC